MENRGVQKWQKLLREIGYPPPRVTLENKGGQKCQKLLREIGYPPSFLAGEASGSFGRAQKALPFLGSKNFQEFLLYRGLGT